MRVLVVNAGSSGLKLSVVGAGERVEWSRVIPVQDQVWDEREVERVLPEVPAVACGEGEISAEGSRVREDVEIVRRVLG